jgi:glucose/arabinose dehydrogenase|tara:strand:- start:2354 stop:2881 length:528 start_codon:yes stop_codon:yes gene_type:complete
VANQDYLVSFEYTQGATSIAGSGTELTRLPARINHHWTKAMTASADGSKLYVGVGSNSNVGERGMDVEENRAVICEVDRESGASRIYASGIRNPTALAINPWTEQLWSVVNERDELGPQLVPGLPETQAFPRSTPAAANLPSEPSGDRVGLADPGDYFVFTLACFTDSGSRTAPS